MIPLEIPDLEQERRFVGRGREATSATGEQLRFTVLSIDVEPASDGRTLRRRLRYERTRPGAAPEVLERDWRTRWWSQAQFAEIVGEASFSRTSLRGLGGGPAAPDAPVFVALAQR